METASIEDEMKVLKNKITDMDEAINEFQMDHLQKYGSLSCVDEDGYKRLKSEVCEDVTLYTLHKCHFGCIMEMMREHHWWDYSTFGFNIYAFRQLLDLSVKKRRKTRRHVRKRGQYPKGKS